MTPLATPAPPSRARTARSRALAVLLLLATLGAGCSLGPGSPSARPEDLGGGDASCGDVVDGVRRIDHWGGTTEVALDPQRVVLLDTGEMDAADAVGVVPVGVVAVGDFVDLPSYLSEGITAAERVGTIAQPDLEAITRLRPDLILGNRVRDRNLYDQLSAIAPTVLADDIGPMWRDNFVLYATAMGRCRQAEERLAAYDQQVADTAAALGPDRGEVQVSVVRALYGTVRIYHERSFVSSVLEDIGLGRPPSQSEDALMKEVGIDKVASLEGDVIVYSQWGSVQPLFDQMRSTEVWAAFPAVRDGKVFEVTDSTWMLGLGVLGATSVAEDVERLLAG